MRRPNRNIEIFSMSVLDMFASALGAFIIVSVILFPYYKKEVFSEVDTATAALKSKADELKQENEQKKQLDGQLARQEQELQRGRLTLASLNQCKEAVAECQSEVAKTFLLIQIKWGVGRTPTVGVHLHVTDPDNNEFYWAKTNRSGQDFPHTKAQLSIDVTRGPGIEAWLSPEASPGTYLVDYEIIDDHPNIDIDGFYFDRTGKKPLATKTVLSGQSRVHAATIEVAANGTITMH